MERIPKAWMFTLGLSAFAVVAALIASTLERRPPPDANDVYDAQIESCFRYGRLECCVKPE